MCSIEFLQINEICRACLKSDPKHLQSLFSEENATIFTNCTSIEISKDDGLPGSLCLECFQTLNKTFKFQQLCVTSDATLKEYILNPKYQTLGSNIVKIIENKSTTYPLTTSELIPHDTIPNYDKNVITEPNVNNTHDVSDLLILCTNEDNTFNYSSDDNGKNCEDDIQEKEAADKNVIVLPPIKDKESIHRDVKSLKKKNNLEIKRLECTICKKVIKNIDRMDAHLRVHEGKKPEVCKQCGKDFSDIRSLRRHMLKHNDVKKYHCNICDKQFTYSTSLSQHMRIHANIRQFVCDICGKSFVQGNGLTSHLLSHSSDTPFPCEICGKRFKSQNFLKSHIVRHASFKNFVCSLCGKLFATNTELTTHIRSHTGEKPYICTHCKKCFKTRSHLNEHKKSHMAVRPFVCDLCPRSFAYSKVLRNHRMTHTGEKPYECFICQRAFTQKGALTVHMRTHKPLNNY